MATAVRTDCSPTGGSPVTTTSRALPSELTMAIRADKYRNTASVRRRIPWLTDATQLDRIYNYSLRESIHSDNGRRNWSAVLPFKLL